jgi:hypothetical protein
MSLWRDWYCLQFFCVPLRLPHQPRLMSTSRTLSCRTVTAQQLDKPPGFMAGLCAGIVVLPERMRFCPPPSSTNAQQQRVVVLYAEKHPERLHENFKRLVVDALREAWPCP